LRNLVNQAFTPRAVARLSDRITQITQELLDRVRAEGKMDVVSDIAFPLDADGLSDQDHGHPTVYPLPLDEQGLAHK
jgi:cytochrome P450